jgi:hypothetical protein
VVITTASATTLTLPAGGSVSFPFNVSSLGTVSGPITLTLGPLPAGVTGTFTRSSVTASGVAVADSLTLSAAPAATAGLGPGRGIGALLACGIFALPFAGGRKRAGRFLCVLGLLLLAGLAGCAFSSTSVTGNPPGTSPVTSTVTLTASAPGATPAVTTLQLTVQ